MFSRLEIDLIQQLARLTNILVKSDVAANVQEISADNSAILRVHPELVGVISKADWCSCFDDLLHVMPSDKPRPDSPKQCRDTRVA